MKRKVDIEDLANKLDNDKNKYCDDTLHMITNNLYCDSNCFYTIEHNLPSFDADCLNCPCCNATHARRLKKIFIVNQKQAIKNMISKICYGFDNCDKCPFIYKGGCSYDTLSREGKAGYLKMIKIILEYCYEKKG